MTGFDVVQAGINLIGQYLFCTFFLAMVLTFDHVGDDYSMVCQTSDLISLADTERRGAAAVDVA